MKEREERVKRVRQEQENERIRKAEEWKQQVSNEMDTFELIQLWWIYYMIRVTCWNSIDLKYCRNNIFPRTRSILFVLFYFYIIQCFKRTSYIRDQTKKLFLQICLRCEWRKVENTASVKIPFQPFMYIAILGKSYFVIKKYFYMRKTFRYNISRLRHLCECKSKKELSFQLFSEMLWLYPIELPL